MEHKLIVESWRKYLAKEYTERLPGGLGDEYPDEDSAPVDAAEPTQRQIDINYGGVDIVTVALESVFELWNTTLGEWVFKIPGTLGAEEYTLSDLTIEVVETLLGVKVAGIVAKSAGKLYKMMKMRKKTGSFNISEDDFTKILHGYTVLLRRKPDEMQKFVAGLAGLASYASKEVAPVLTGDEIKAYVKQVQGGFDQGAKSIEKLN